MRVSKLRELFAVEGAVEVVEGARYFIRLPASMCQQNVVDRITAELALEGIRAVIVTSDVEIYRIEDD